MFEQIESYQPITITIEASCFASRHPNDRLPPQNPSFTVERENMTFLLCSTAISNHIQHIKFLLFHDPHFPACRRTFFNPHDEHTQSIKEGRSVISVLALPFIKGCVLCL